MSFLPDFQTMDELIPFALPYEVAETIPMLPLQWLDAIPPPPSAAVPLRRRWRSRMRETLRRILGRRCRYSEPNYPVLSPFFVDAFQEFFQATDYQRIIMYWDSLWQGIFTRAPPGQRTPTESELGQLSSRNSIFQHALFFQLAGEALEAEERALVDFNHLVSLNRPAMNPATPWRDAIEDLCTDEPENTFAELEREIRLFGDRCHLFHVGRTPQDYEDDPNLSRQEGRDAAGFWDPWQLLAQRRWIGLAERLEMDIQWLERTRHHATAESQQANQFASFQLRNFRDRIFIDIDAERLDRGTAIFSVDVNPELLPIAIRGFLMTRLIIPQ